MTTNRKLMQEICEQFLVCKICFESYKRPKTLCCLHVFCCDCLEKHQQAELERSYRYLLYSRAVTCPICRKKTDLPPGGIIRLPDNFLVANLGEVVSRRRSSQESALCQICPSDCQRSPAAIKCLDCCKLLCSHCRDLHLSTKVTAAHSLFDVEVEKSVQCRLHADEVMRFYCEPCRICICVLCTFQEHKGHDIASLAEGIERHAGPLRQLLQRGSRCTEQLGMKLTAIENCESKMRQIEEQIQEAASSAITSVRIHEKALLQELYRLYGEDTLKFLKQKRDIQEVLESVDSACKLADAVLSQRSIELLLLKQELESKLSSSLATEHDDHIPDIPAGIAFDETPHQFGRLVTDAPDFSAEFTLTMSWRNDSHTESWPGSELSIEASTATSSSSSRHSSRSLRSFSESTAGGESVADTVGSDNVFEDESTTDEIESNGSLSEQSRHKISHSTHSDGSDQVDVSSTNLTADFSCQCDRFFATESRQTQQPSPSSAWSNDRSVQTIAREVKCNDSSTSMNSWVASQSVAQQCDVYAKQTRQTQTVSEGDTDSVKNVGIQCSSRTPVLSRGSQCQRVVLSCTATQVQPTTATVEVQESRFKLMNSATQSLVREVAHHMVQTERIGACDAGTDAVDVRADCYDSACQVVPQTADKSIMTSTMLVNSSTEMPRVLFFDKEINTRSIFLINSSVGTDATASKDVACNTKNVNDIYSHISAAEQIRYSNCGTCTKNLTAANTMDRSSSPIQSKPCSADKSTMVTPAQIKEPVDKIQRVSLRSNDLGKCSDSLRKSIEQIKEEMKTISEADEETEEEMSQSAPCMTSFSVVAETKSVAQRSKAVSTEAVSVDVKMAECINKLKTVRQRLEIQIPAESPVYSLAPQVFQTKTTNARVTERPSVAAISSSSEKSNEGRETSSSCFAATTSNSHEAKLKARQQRLDISQLLRSSSLPETSSPPSPPSTIASPPKTPPIPARLSRLRGGKVEGGVSPLRKCKLDGKLPQALVVSPSAKHKLGLVSKVASPPTVKRPLDAAARRMNHTGVQPELGRSVASLSQGVAKMAPISSCKRSDLPKMATLMAQMRGAATGVVGSPKLHVRSVPGSPKLPIKDLGQPVVALGPGTPRPLLRHRRCGSPPPRHLSSPRQHPKVSALPTFRPVGGSDGSSVDSCDITGRPGNGAIPLARRKRP